MKEITSEEKKMLDDMIGIMAYDQGCTDSGIRDELRREEIKKWLHVLAEDPKRNRYIMGRYIRNTFLSDAALDLGYGLEDIHGFFNWLSEYMDYDF